MGVYIYIYIYICIYIYIHIYIYISLSLSPALPLSRSPSLAVSIYRPVRLKALGLKALNPKARARFDVKGRLKSNSAEATPRPETWVV